MLAKHPAPRHPLRPPPRSPRGGGRDGDGQAPGPAGWVVPADKRLDLGLTFNGSQRWSCSATHETPTQNQVVYESFCTGLFHKREVRVRSGDGALSAAPGSGLERHSSPEPEDSGYPGPIGFPRRCGIVAFRRDSDLEAFSHNPTDGSFAPVAPQPSARTKCLNLRFLSY